MDYIIFFDFLNLCFFPNEDSAKMKAQIVLLKYI